ncbi:exosome complex component RRP45-like [Littorina saxatilis]|uniref:Exosome complex component RRP45 n=1 Tax=Littorina saxatilis TaxID=31220 RepID=A0AAN9G6M4_9CAEN
MRDVPISNCEREFLLAIIAEKKRVDGRQPTDLRQVKIQFGSNFGSCEVSFGKTRVLATVSSEVAAPKQRRPNEGILFVNVELSPMGHPSFEQGRQTEESVELNRLMERCLKESRCVDLESLCIVVGEKVWTVRVDVTVVNQDGNMLDCASIAAIAALAHFKRPDVTVKGQEITIHTSDERDPIPLSIHHMPLCVTFAFFHQGKFLLIDPQEREERVTEGKMVIGMNKHREICMLQVTGQMLLHQDKVKQCTKMAFVKVVEMTELIQEALANDKTARSKGEKCGFAMSSEKEINTTVSPAKLVEDVSKTDLPMSSDSDSGSEQEMVEAGPQERPVGDSPKVVGKGVAIIGSAAVKKWEEEEERVKGDKKGKKKKEASVKEASVKGQQSRPQASAYF